MQGLDWAAFHAGTLLALGLDLGWDPNSADVIVGSSAGSIVGTLLRAGIDVHVFEPDAATLRSMGINALDRVRTPLVSRDAFLAVARQIAANESLRRALGSPHARSSARACA